MCPAWRTDGSDDPDAGIDEGARRVSRGDAPVFTRAGTRPRFSDRSRGPHSERGFGCSPSSLPSPLRFPSHHLSHYLSHHLSHSPSHCLSRRAAALDPGKIWQHHSRSWCRGRFARSRVTGRPVHLPRARGVTRAAAPGGRHGERPVLRAGCRRASPRAPPRRRWPGVWLSVRGAAAAAWPATTTCRR